MSRPGYQNGLRILAALSCLAISHGASAETNDAQARRLLKAMSDYMGQQPGIEAEIDTAVEIITPQIEKLSFNSSSKLTMARPNKVRLERVGGFASLDMIFDGANLTIRDRLDNSYGQVPIKGSIDNLVDEVTDKLGMATPGIDLMLADSYSALIADVIEAKYIGDSMVQGERCDHLAFRNDDVDWQIWIRKGAEKFPCKMVITTKTMAQAPQYTTTIRSMRTNAKIAAASFAFTPAVGERRVEYGKLSVDEIPQSEPAKVEKK